MRGDDFNNANHYIEWLDGSGRGKDDTQKDIPEKQSEFLSQDGVVSRFMSKYMHYIGSRFTFSYSALSSGRCTHAITLACTSSR